MSQLPETGPLVNISESTTLFHPRRPRKGAQCVKYRNCPLMFRTNTNRPKMVSDDESDSWLRLSSLTSSWSRSDWALMMYLFTSRFIIFCSNTHARTHTKTNVSISVPQHSGEFSWVGDKTTQLPSALEL